MNYYRKSSYKSRYYATRRETDGKLVTSEVPFAVKEAFSLLRTNLLYSPVETEGAAVYAVTSDLEASGKSLVLANLAVSFAQTGKRTLLIDADMRCSVQYLYFGYERNRAGLSEYLSGQVTEKDDYIIPSGCENLDVIAGGKTPPNPSELLLGRRFSELLESAKKEYDYIFVDFPPVGVVSDAVSVAGSVTGYLVVVRSGKSKEQSFRSAVDALEAVGATVTGLILNDVDRKRVGGVNYYYSYLRLARKRQQKAKKAEESET